MIKKIVGIVFSALLIVATVLPVAGDIKIGSIDPLEPIDTSVNLISPYNMPSSPLTITATGPSDLDDVTLYYRWSSDNISWEPWTILTFDDFEEGNFGNYTDGGGDCSLYGGGTYAHSGIYAADIQDNSGDSSSFYHTSSIDVDTPGFTRIKVDFWFFSVGLNYYHDFFVEYYDGSSWETAAQYIQGIDFSNGQFYNEIVWINETEYTFPSDMKIKFRCDAYGNNDDVYIDDIWVNAKIGQGGGNGVNWSIWNNANNPDTSYPWSWNFDFPNSTGYYEFYSIGKKTGEADETAPLIADTQCRFNRMPEIFNEEPNNGSTDLELIPKLNISVSDADSDTMNLNWYSNSSGSWQVFGSNINIGDGTYRQKNSNFSDYDTTYWWYVTVADDFYTNSSPIFHFTTEKNYPPNTPTNPDPENGESNVNINADLSWSGDDPDGDNVTFDVYFGPTSPPPKVVTNQSETSYDPGILNFDEEYFWQIVIWDSPGGLSTPGPIWSFTTEENLPPFTPSGPDPENGATDVPIEGILTWSGGDPNTADTVTYDMYFGKSSPPPLIFEDLSQPAYDPETMDLSTTYYWQIVAEDSQGLTSSGPIWYFSTELEPNDPPSAPEIYGSSRGPPGEELSWGFSSDDPDDNQVKYIIEWGDGDSEETDYYQDSTLIEVFHTYDEEGDYTIKAKAEDEKGLIGEENTFTVKITVSRVRIVYHPLLLHLFERFPNLFPIIKYLLGL